MSPRPSSDGFQDPLHNVPPSVQPLQATPLSTSFLNMPPGHKACSCCFKSQPISNRSTSITGDESWDDTFAPLGMEDGKSPEEFMEREYRGQQKLEKIEALRRDVIILLQFLLTSIFSFHQLFWTISTRFEGIQHLIVISRRYRLISKA